jgi:hypothetical protein
MDQTDTRVTAGVRVFYAWWRRVQVTSAIVTVDDVNYVVREMRGLRVRRGRVRPVRRVVVALAVVQAAVVGLALVKLVQANGATVVSYGVVAAQLLATAVLCGLARMRWPRPSQLWVSYRGEPTLLFECGDRYEFGKMARAVAKAMRAQRLLK